MGMQVVMLCVLIGSFHDSEVWALQDPFPHLHRRRLNPTTCTGIPDGADAFGSVSLAASTVRNQDEDCLVPGTGWHEHPHQPDMKPSSVEMCISLDNSTRYIFSNGLPNHAIYSPPDRPIHCTVPFAVSMPLAPIYDGTYLEENPVAGPLGFALNGVPLLDAAWAVDNGFLFDEAAWNGHAHSAELYWHYHSSRMPPSGNYPGQEELVGYAMDGFPIFGPIDVVENVMVLDECNGRLDEDGNYRYHMIRMEDIDFSLPQCNANDARVHNWKPIIGCYRGRTSQSRVWIDDGNRQGMTCSSSSLQVNEHIYIGLPEVGDWGGTCTCPNGEVYQVGDNNDGCQSLACIGGVSGSCSEDNVNAGGAGYRALCGTVPPTPSPTTAMPSLAISADTTLSPQSQQPPMPTSVSPSMGINEDSTADSPQPTALWSSIPSSSAWYIQISSTTLAAVIALLSATLA